jgi:hypothetical protein
MKTGCCPAVDNNLISAKSSLPEKALFFLELLVFFTEALDTTGGVHQLLFAGKKRVALGTDFDRNPLFGRAQLKRGPAGTLDGRIFVFRMDIWLHNNLNPLHNY